MSRSERPLPPDVTVVGLLWAQNAERVKRYDGIKMTHRTDLWTHARRTTFLAMNLTMAIEDTEDLVYDPRKIVRLAYHHDDAEFLTGDTPGNIKRAMNPEERAELSLREDSASRALAKYYLNIADDLNVDQYIADQKEIREKKTLEAQIVDVADKLDALGEIVHELRCGNLDFIPVFQRYVKVFQDFERYDFWRKVKSNPKVGMEYPLTISEVLLIEKISPDSFPTRESMEEKLMTEKHLPPYYGTWLALTFMGFGVGTEKYLFPGWYMDFWKKWGIPRDVRSTLRGIELT